jgi:hypothetical protein
MLVQKTLGSQDQNRVLTFSDAVAAVSAFTADADEVLAVVVHMLQCGSIRLTGAAPFAPRAPDPHTTVPD